MIKKNLIIIFTIFLLNAPICSAEKISNANRAYKQGSSDKTYMIGKNSNYKKALDALKQAKKYDKKGKLDKAKKRFNDVIKFLLLSNDENPNQPEIFSYLGFSYKKVDDLLMSEIYYNQGLGIDPLNIEINRYLGELYVETNRIIEAKERLKILKNCNCEEYNQLKKIIN